MKVFLDLDGVVVDFRRGICEAFNRDDPSPNWNFWKDWEGVSTKDVDDKCDVAFWANLCWTLEGKQILKYIENRVGAANIFLLTTPMLNPGSWSGKILWVEEHIPEYKNRTIITQAPKALFARPDRMLVDDKDENINEFRKAGGRAIRIARPWNCAWEKADKVVYKLRNDWSNNKDGDHRRDIRLKIRYGITLKEYNRMFATQDGRCAICGTHQTETERRFHLDHNHETEKVRGILCEPCNLLIGMVKENPSTLINAAIYLEEQ